jgi:hypothetical protein
MCLLLGCHAGTRCVFDITQPHRRKECEPTSSDVSHVRHTHNFPRCSADNDVASSGHIDQVPTV